MEKAILHFISGSILEVSNEVAIKIQEVLINLEDKEFGWSNINQENFTVNYSINMKTIEWIEFIKKS